MTIITCTVQVQLPGGTCTSTGTSTGVLVVTDPRSRSQDVSVVSRDSRLGAENRLELRYRYYHSSTASTPNGIPDSAPLKLCQRLRVVHHRWPHWWPQWCGPASGCGRRTLASSIIGYQWVMTVTRIWNDHMPCDSLFVKSTDSRHHGHGLTVPVPVDDSIKIIWCVIIVHPSIPSAPSIELHLIKFGFQSFHGIVFRITSIIVR